MQEWQQEGTIPRITSARLAFCQSPVTSAGRVSSALGWSPRKPLVPAL